MLQLPGESAGRRELHRHLALRRDLRLPRAVFISQQIHLPALRGRVPDGGVPRADPRRAGRDRVQRLPERADGGERVLRAGVLDQVRPDGEAAVSGAAPTLCAATAAERQVPDAALRGQSPDPRRPHLQTPAQRGAQVPLHARAPALLPDHAVHAAALRSQSPAGRRRKGRALRHAGEVMTGLMRAGGGLLLYFTQTKRIALLSL